MITPKQIPYFSPMRVDQVIWPYPSPQAIHREPSLLETVIKVAAAGLVIGAAAVAVVTVCDALFGPNDTIRHCSECGSASHDARNCLLSGPRTRLRIEKTGICACCGGNFRYTELHHYAGRGVARGKEMCGPCHFWCGHDGDWQSYPINPRYCRLAA